MKQSPPLRIEKTTIEILLPILKFILLWMELVTQWILASWEVSADHKKKIIDAYGNAKDEIKKIS